MGSVLDRLVEIEQNVRGRQQELAGLWESRTAGSYALAQICGTALAAVDITLAEISILHRRMEAEAGTVAGLMASLGELETASLASLPDGANRDNAVTAFRLARVALMQAGLCITREPVVEVGDG